MKDKLAIIVLGESNAGKSKTWYTLFNRKRMKTAWQGLTLGNDKLKVILVNGSPEERGKEIADILKVFLVNGSPEERGKEISDLLNNQIPQIVLCSVQYTPHGKETIKWFIDNGYEIYIQWLNPGYINRMKYEDDLNFMGELSCNKFVEFDSINLIERTNSIKEYIIEWRTIKKSNIKL